jgi:hypothetical protein
MSGVDWLTVICFALAAWPALQFSLNISKYRKPDVANASPTDAVSILIPARNEHMSIRECVESALQSRWVSVEVVVLDDHSNDGTAEVVREIAARDSRVRLLNGADLPPGWSGKQFACQQLGKAAKNDYLLFIDADVRLVPDGAAQMVQFHRQTECGLVSGVPRQITGTCLEKLVIPLIHFLLLCYLPIGRMRQLRIPALGAGCGQLFFTTASAYRQVGGHESIKASFHDGVKLPRAYRRAGQWTDLFDATDVASCRMYHSAAQLWNGLAKNAGEGIGSITGIIPWSVFLLGGHVVPFGLLFLTQGWAFKIAIAAVLLSYYPRFVCALRFRQSWLGVAFHPIGIVLLLGIQWYSLVRRMMGRPVGWKGRGQPPTGTSVS